MIKLMSSTTLKRFEIEQYFFITLEEITSDLHACAISTTYLALIYRLKSIVIYIETLINTRINYSVPGYVYRYKYKFLSTSSPAIDRFNAK